MSTIKEQAVQHAIDMGYPVDTGEHNRCVSRYLAGAKAMKEICRRIADDEAKRRHESAKRYVLSPQLFAEHEVAGDACGKVADDISFIPTES